MAMGIAIVRARRVKLFTHTKPTRQESRFQKTWETLEEKDCRDRIGK